jgi:hypothetical protein
MASGVVWGQATFRMLGTVAMLQRDQLWNSVARRRQRVAAGSEGVRRRHVAFGDGILVVCLFALGGLLLLGSLLMLLSWVTVTVPPRELKSCSEFERCVAPATDGNESLWADDPLTGRLRMAP